MKERKAVTRELAVRYRCSGKKQKGRILDEFVALTQYNRSYASYMLNNHGKRIWYGSEVFILDAVKKFKRRRREKIYDEDVKRVLVRIWEMMSWICGKRLKAILPEVVEKLKEFKEIIMSRETEQKVLKISPATIDRMLRPERKKYALRIRSKTRPGSLLKSQIPIRTFAEWNERRPGFMEMDLVAHDGGLACGDYCQSLNVVDIYSGWTEIVAVKNKAQIWVFEAIDKMRHLLPFALLGLDSDNGGEFINAHLNRYCLMNKINFTRSRKYRKDDNCYVEQKNYTVVRKYVGYSRYDTENELKTLNELYEYLRLYVNFFQPLMKCIKKTRHGSKVKREYDQPRTSYQRLLEFRDISKQEKEKLRKQYSQLNPAELHRRINKLQQVLWRYGERKQRRSSVGEFERNYLQQQKLEKQICYTYG